MLQGIDTAAIGMASIIDQNDIIANNLANVNTIAFKQLIPTFRNIEEAEIPAQGQNIAPKGSLSLGSMIDTTSLDFSQGSLKKTNRTLDVAINGEGFFVVENSLGEFYTRNGNFTLNEDGDLVTKTGDKVLSESGGEINISIEQNLSKLCIAEDGRLMYGNEEIGKLKIVNFEDASKLKAFGHSLFKNTDPGSKPEEMERPNVAQGYLESSNANVVKSMIDSITGSRTYEVLSKVIRDSDGTLRKTVTEVGTVST